MEKNWYVVHTYSGFEEKVKIAIEEKLDKQDLKDKISQFKATFILVLNKE